MKNSERGKPAATHWVLAELSRGKPKIRIEPEYDARKDKRLMIASGSQAYCDIYAAAFLDGFITGLDFQMEEE